jgi:DNA-binding YbaB/EbfC family protein
MVDQPDNQQFEDLMAKAKDMQQQMQDIQSRITQIEVTGEAGGGLVKVVMNGAHYVKRVEISPTLMGEEEDMLEDLTAAAFNDAANRVEKITKEEMMGLAKDMQLPEGFGGEDDA